MSAVNEQVAGKPSHVPDDLVFDFDLYAIPNAVEFHQSLHQIQQTHPDVFWTPKNGGHWVVTRAADIEEVLKQPDKFSSSRVLVPRDDSAPHLLPVEADPPLHTELRRPLNKVLANPGHLEPNVRSIAATLIDEIAPRGQCEFVADFAKIMPMCVFLDLVQLPREDRFVLVPLVGQFLQGGTVAARAQAQESLFEYLLRHIRLRRANPGEDLFSDVVTCKVAGEQITEAQALSFMHNLLLGGLDTVTATLTWIVRFLARAPDQRAKIVAKLGDRPYIARAVDELLRAHGVAMSCRVVTRDLTFKGVQMLRDDMVLSVYNMGSLDDRRFPDPMQIDFERKNARQHTTFGKYTHFCAGSRLATLEVIVFLQEWLSRIPNFRLVDNVTLHCVPGATSALESLPLEWDRPARDARVQG